MSNLDHAADESPAEEGTNHRDTEDTETRHTEKTANRDKDGRPSVRA
jgi:hypothetical protein